jgi:hypothetical protein
MNSAFLVFDLVGGVGRDEVKCWVKELTRRAQRSRTREDEILKRAMHHPVHSNLLRWFVLLLYELQDLSRLFARWLPFALSPSHKRLSRNSQCVGDSRGVLGYNVAIVSQSGVLLFGRFHLHLLTISELVATVSHYSFGGRSKRSTQETQEIVRLRLLRIIRP